MGILTKHELLLGFLVVEHTSAHVLKALFYSSPSGCFAFAIGLASSADVACVEVAAWTLRLRATLQLLIDDLLNDLCFEVLRIVAVLRRRLARLS